MFGTQDLALFTLTVFVLNATPGVDMAFTLLSTLRGGIRAGLAASAGICAGCVVHTLAAAFGLAALMAASSAAFNTVKWAGAAYLLWLAIGLLRQALRAGVTAVAGETPDASVGTAAQLFRQGFLTNVLNPKVALFFLAFVPQFIAPGVDNKPLAFLMLGLLFNFNGLWVNVGWALTAAWMGRRLGSVRAAMHWLECGAGLIFIGFGIRLALADNPPR